MEPWFIQLMLNKIDNILGLKMVHIYIIIFGRLHNLYPNVMIYLRNNATNISSRPSTCRVYKSTSMKNKD